MDPIARLSVGLPVSIVPQMQELTTQRAANLLEFHASFLFDSSMVKNCPPSDGDPSEGVFERLF